MLFIYILILASVVEQAQHTIRTALAQAENPTHSTVTCPAGLLSL